MSADPFAKRAIEISLKDVSVMVGMPAGGNLSPFTVQSLLTTFSRCQRLDVGCELGMVAHCSVIQWARDEVIDLFLKSDCNRLFWIDSDMTWSADQFVRLLALSQQRDVVCGAYPAKTDRPTFYLKYDTTRALNLDSLGLLPILGTGLGFTVMSREVIEVVAAAAPRAFDEISQRDMAQVFRIDTADGHRRGEDMAFFSDIRQAGYDVWLDPSINLGHIGHHRYTAQIRDALKLS